MNECRHLETLPRHDIVRAFLVRRGVTCFANANGSSRGLLTILELPAAIVKSPDPRSPRWVPFDILQRSQRSACVAHVTLLDVLVVVPEASVS